VVVVVGNEVALELEDVVELFADDVAVVDQGLPQLQQERTVALPEQLPAAPHLSPYAPHHLHVHPTHRQELLGHVHDVHKLVLLHLELFHEVVSELGPGGAVDGVGGEHEFDEFDDVVRGSLYGVVTDFVALLVEVAGGQVAVDVVLVVLLGEGVPPEDHFVDDDSQRPHVG